MKNIIQKSFRTVLLAVCCLAIFPIGSVFAAHEPPPPGSQLVGPSVFATVKVGLVEGNTVVSLENMVCSKGGKSFGVPTTSATFPGTSVYDSIIDQKSFSGFFFTGGVSTFGLDPCYTKNEKGKDELFAVDIIVESAHNYNLDSFGFKSAELVILGVSDKPNWPK